MRLICNMCLITRVYGNIYIYMQAEGDEVEDDPDKLKPYKKDLDYLDDHFKLITLKLKVKGMDSRIEMEVSGGNREGSRSMLGCYGRLVYHFFATKE